MKIKEIIVALERFAPLPLQDDYDNSGLQVGLTETEATGALLCLDVTEAVLAEARTLGCNMVVSHHPVLFHPLRSLTEHDINGRCIIKAVQEDIVIYSSHTNLDNVKGGVNDRIASILGLSNTKPIVQRTEGNGSGVIGDLSKPIILSELFLILQDKFTVSVIRHNKCVEKQVQRIAVCGGSGSFLIQDALKLGADSFITGEVGYHHFFGFENIMSLIEIGHYESEQFTIELLYEVISNSFPSLPLFKTTINTNPIEYTCNNNRR